MENPRPASAPLPDAWVDRLFSVLVSFYGARFADMWRGSDLNQVRAVWASELGGYSGEEIARGIAGCRARHWPPTLPEFLELCRPPLDPQSAYLEAVEQLVRRRDGHDRWSHPAIFWTAAHIGTHEISVSNWGGMKERWTNAFRKEFAKGVWPEIPARREALPPPGKISVSPEEQKKRLAEIFQMLGAKKRPQDLEIDD